MPVHHVVASESIQELINFSREVFSNDDLIFLDSCLFYLEEGFDAQQAIELSMVDFLVDM